MTFKGFDVDKGEGTFGFGTNKQKAYFSDVSMKPLKVPKAEKTKVETEELLALVNNMKIAGPDGPNVPGADAPDMELPAAASAETPELPGAALGLDGGMAPKIEEVAQEEMPTVKTCSVVDTPEMRNTWCNKHYGDKPKFYKDCQQDFCTLCCKLTIIPEKHTKELNPCVKICHSKNKPVEDPTLNNTCFAPPTPGTSI